MGPERLDGKEAGERRRGLVVEITGTQFFGAYEWFVHNSGEDVVAEICREKPWTPTSFGQFDLPVLQPMYLNEALDIKDIIVGQLEHAKRSPGETLIYNGVVGGLALMGVLESCLWIGKEDADDLRASLLEKAGDEDLVVVNLVSPEAAMEVDPYLTTCEEAISKGIERYGGVFPRGVVGYEEIKEKKAKFHSRFNQEIELAIEQYGDRFKQIQVFRHEGQKMDRELVMRSCLAALIDFFESSG